ncbi:MAG: hypothetical protein COV36_05630 [Alphaproteobacteria bacterium CG11_big_fil_rev_8_21_14_0_20_44_7]|nr:MAG: hypothetical protein COV36_05630 [Alphaproteobacteria bacterium CG11_big_fil_rev_8_21_14_0_20_44_7]
MILQTNIDDKIYQSLLKNYSEDNIGVVINQILAEHLEDNEDTKLADSRFHEATLSIGEVKKGLNLDVEN